MPSSASNNLSHKPTHASHWGRYSMLRGNNDDDSDDDEYARFMRSIMNGDDASIMTFKTLASATAKSTAGGGGNGGVGSNGGLNNGDGGPNLGTIVGDESMIGSAFDDLDDASYHLTSEEEEDDDDDDDDDENDEDDDDEEEDGNDHSQQNENDGEEKKETDGSPTKTKGKASSKSKLSKDTKASPQVSTKKGSLPPTPMSGSSTLISPEGTDDDFDQLNVFGEIEGLMEEDLEAAVATLLQTDPLTPSAGGEASFNWQVGPSSASGTPGASMARAKTGVASASAAGTVGIGQAAVAGTQQQKAITTPGQSTKKKKSTTTVVTTPSPGLSSPHASNMSHGTARSGPGLAPVGPVITGDQLRRLRETMARHHQLLLQQATLAVRAAYVQKVQKDGPVSSSSSAVREPALKKQKTADNSLPPSRLNSRSLTFCTPEQKCTYDNDFFNGENADELAEVLDGAVGMLQDLEQNWKDAVRNSIQLSFAPNGNGSSANGQAQGSRRRLLPTVNEKSTYAEDEKEASNEKSEQTSAVCRPLTRSAFTKTLREREMEMLSGAATAGDSSSMQTGGPVRQRVSVFDVRGLGRLRETFAAIDNSVKDAQMGRKASAGKENGMVNILLPKDHGDACELLLRHAGAEIDLKFVPGRMDLGKHLTYAPEAFDSPETVKAFLTKAQQLELKKNRNQFTAGEDNLILRGVNLYGEKEWVLISDRFLPDRVVNSISQRYNRICFLIYKANGIYIDEEGKLGPIPVHEKGAENFDEEAIAKIKRATPPTTMNVHRWTLEEDITLLKAVPVMGNMWAEICNRLMPHRDRGHIRKRYQVLERRIPKGVTKMNMRHASLKRPADRYVVPIKPAKYARPVPVKGSPLPLPPAVPVSAPMPAPIPVKSIPVPAPVPVKQVPVKLPAAKPAAAKSYTKPTASKPSKTAPKTASKKSAKAPASKTTSTKTKATTTKSSTSKAEGTKSKQPKAATSKSTASDSSKKKTATKNADKSKSKSSPSASESAKNTKKKETPVKSETTKSEEAPPMAIRASPPKKVSLRPKPSTPENFRPFSGENSALHAAMKTEGGEGRPIRPDPSPETRNMAALLEGFSSASHLQFAREQELSRTGQELSPVAENTQMGVEKILENGDSWSQASRMERLLQIGAAESNFVRQMVESENEQSKQSMPLSPTKASQLPMLDVDDAEASGLSIINEYQKKFKQNNQDSMGSENTGERKSILSSVMEKTKENELKRKAGDAPPGTPTKSVDFHQVASPAKENIFTDGFVPTSHPTSAFSYTLGTPGQVYNLGTPGPDGLNLTNFNKSNFSVGEDFFNYFMSDKSRQTGDANQSDKAASPAKAAPTSPSKFSMSPGRFSSSPSKYTSSPAKFGIDPNTPLAQLHYYEGLSGPIDGHNSLLMGASDFDAVSALKDLSNSAPPTPSKFLLKPRDASKEPEPMHSDDIKEESKKPAEEPPKKKPVSLFAKVKAKLDERDAE